MGGWDRGNPKPESGKLGHGDYRPWGFGIEGRSKNLTRYRVGDTSKKMKSKHVVSTFAALHVLARCLGSRAGVGLKALRFRRSNALT